MRLNSLELPSIFPSFDISAQSQHVLNASPEEPMFMSDIVEVVTPEAIAIREPDNQFNFEQAGKVTGTWFGLVYGLATLPVVALDGPLPFFDAAWAFSTYRFTRRSTEVGGLIGKEIDDLIA
tara:strand:+ start:182 stop:547 length:366 start_codon:yes stop_codon:yes gene_type:complete